MAYKGWLPRCVICKRAVDLTESKTDEHGQAVHEECYVSMIVSANEPFTHLGLKPSTESHFPGAGMAI
jgi:hypothetical protein